MQNATARNLHVPLPPRLYRALRLAAERQGRPATQVAREAILLWLASEKKREMERELRAYVATTAGGPDDLEPALEAAAIEQLAPRRNSLRPGAPSSWCRCPPRRLSAPGP